MKDIDFHFYGRNYVVVGASSGMGRQIALELAEAGANVLCLGRRLETLEEVAEDVTSGGEPGRIIPFVLDVTKAAQDDWERCLDEFVQEYGILSGGVYTAGITGITVLRSWSEKLANAIMDTSYWGMLRFMQSVSKKCYAKEGASFVVFSSVAAYTGTQGMMVYAGAKAAVQTSVRAMAKEISKARQRINSISPGWVRTEMTDNYASEFGMHEKVKELLWLGEGGAGDVSGMAMFLLSDRAKWITGTDILVDGGYKLGGV